MSDFTDRNLNQKQFMSIDELKRLKSIDSAKPGGTVGEELPRKRREIVQNYQVYNSVRNSMKEKGQTAPLCVSGDKLLQGHHRIAIAEDLGWEKMHVSNDLAGSHDLDFDRKHRWERE